VAFYGFAADYSTVSAIEVFENAVVPDLHNYRVLTRQKRIFDLHIVNRFAANRGALLGDSVFLQHHLIDAEYESCHSCLDWRVRANITAKPDAISAPAGLVFGRRTQLALRPI
jgi:hypothetical protein